MKDRVQKNAEELINLRSWLDSQKSVWQNDKRLTESYKRQKLVELDGQARQMLADKLGALWGKHDLVRGLQGGLVWDMLKAAEARLRQAREAYVDTLDAQRLANEYKRVPALLERFDTVQDFERFYDQATTYERRALQDVVTEGDLTRRFPSETGLGHVIKRLRADADQARRSPEIEAAEREFEAAHRLAAGVHEASKQVAKAFDQGDIMSPSMQVLGQVQVQLKVDPEVGKVTYRVGQRPPLLAVKTSVLPENSPDVNA